MTTEPDTWPVQLANLVDGGATPQEYAGSVLEVWMSREKDLIEEWTERALSALYGASQPLVGLRP